jgi:hypothetical protein
MQQQLGIWEPSQHLLKDLKTMHIFIIFSVSARTLQRAPHFTVTNIELLTLFKEVIVLYSESPQIQNAQLLMVKTGGAYLPLGFKGLILIVYLTTTASNLEYMKLSWKVLEGTENKNTKQH